MDSSNPAAGADQVRLHDGIDHVTGLHDNHYFNGALTRMWMSSDDVLPLSMLRVDLDHFTGFNKAYGPIVADEVLCNVAGLIRTLTPSRALVARLVADEFAIVLPGVSAAIAGAIASNICSSLAGMRIANSRSHLGVVTASAGVTTAVSNYDFMWGWQTLMENAAVALDQARFGGGNRSIAHEGTADALGVVSIPSQVRAA